MRKIREVRTISSESCETQVRAQKEGHADRAVRIADGICRILTWILSSFASSTRSPL